MGIVYKGTNTVNGKIYVGKTELTLIQRVRKHVAVRKHPRQVVQRAIAKYGAESFMWEILEEVPNEMLGTVEKRWIASLNATQKEVGYNRAEGGEGGRRTLPDTQETRNKKSLGMLGKRNSAGPRRPMSETHRKALSSAMMGNTNAKRK